MSNDLKNRIIRHISLSGPLPLAEYMHWCMADKTDGYYTHQKSIGREGDFLTAPETSQMFGELIGAWAVNTWKELGKPTPFNLVELGPGNGTLMLDLLRTTALNSEFMQAACINLIETSPALTEKQKETLNEYENIQWQLSISKLDAQPSIIVANELLDVLPTRQYVKHNDSWLERCVGLSDKNELNWILGDGKLEENSLPAGHESEPQGAVYEIALPRETFVTNIAEKIASEGGAALFIDYGHLQSDFGDTFQAMSNHSYVEALATPGKADLTSHVDFDALKRSLEEIKVTCHPFMTQGAFLLDLGLLERAGNLGSGKSAEEQALITRQAERIALPHEMGDLFKVFCFSSLEKLWPFDKQA